MPKARIFFIMQYEKHPVTGETLITEDRIKEALDHKTIKQWAYVKHDKDRWTEADELEDPKHREGETKPTHYHVAISLPKNNVEVDVIANWFGIPSNFVEIKRGRGAFLDCVEYLTHENMKQQELGKYRYDDSEVIANFDWRNELNERALSRSKYGEDMTLKERLRMKVLNGELSLRDVKKNYRINYISDRDMLQKLRMEYISDAEPPAIRHNFYITGGGGMGKGVASICLAHSLFPDIEDEEDLIFRVGAYETSFMGYDGQPVIIWDDFRSGELIRALGSRGNLFQVFETTPKKARQNVKYGSVNLINSVNIVNSVQPWEDFLDGLVGEYTDKQGVRHAAEASEKQQSKRRFPFIMPLRTEDFDILINKGYVDSNNAYDEYYKYQNILGNFGKLAKALPDMVSVVKVGGQMLTPLLDGEHGVHEVEKKRGQDKDAVDLSQFENYGKMESPPTVISVGASEGSDFEEIIEDDGQLPF